MKGSLDLTSSLSTLFDFTSIMNGSLDLSKSEYFSWNTTSPTNNLNDYPFYYVSRPSLLTTISDPILSAIVPALVYWLVSIGYEIWDKIYPSWMERYRLHDSEEVATRNRVSKTQVVALVMSQHAVQAAMALLAVDSHSNEVHLDHTAEIMKLQALIMKNANWSISGDIVARYSYLIPQASWWIYWWGIPTVQFLWAMFIYDTWNYFLHRLFHVVPFFYKHIHAWHHRLQAPYAFAATYQHPVEGFLMDVLGSIVAFSMARMSTRQGILFFGLAGAKGPYDHSGWDIPWDPIHLLFRNHAEYHDIHHQTIGIKSNYAQPFFVHWDVLLGTRMTREELERRRQSNRKKVKAM